MNLNTNQNVTNQSGEASEEITVLNQTKAHPIRTDKYSVVTTQNVIGQLEETGVTWKKVAEENNTPKYKGFGTHLIRCSHPGFIFGDDKLDAMFKPQAYIRNSYHGRTCFELHVAFFDEIKLKGFLLGNKFKTIKIKHIGLSKEEVEAVIDQMKDVFVGEVAPYLKSLMETKIGESERIKFAEAVLRERVRSNHNFIKGEHVKLLSGLKVDSTGLASLWDVLEIVKDNCGLEFRSSPADISYEFTGKDKDGNDVLKDRKISKLKNIQEVTYLNKFLFDKISDYLPKSE
jgi:hypothetical protein